MKYKILMTIVVLISFISSCPIANALEPQTIGPVDDTYVEAINPFTAYGREDYLKVADNAAGPSFVFLKFDLSEIAHVLDALSEVKLRLHCLSVTYPHIIGVYWCTNVTWNEDALTFSSIGDFNRTEDPEGYVIVTSEDTWYQWKVTNIVRIAMKEDYEKLTLVLESNITLEGEAHALFASKDQTTQAMCEYSPQLVFTYLESGVISLDIIIKVVSGLTVIAVIAFLVYKFSKREKRKIRHRKVRVRAHR